MIYKTTGLADLLRARLSEIGSIEVAAIYGSVAKNLEDVFSDIDLLILGDVDLDVLHDATHGAELAIGREINTVVFSRTEWESRIAKRNAFTTDILTGPRINLIGELPQRGDAA